MSLQNRTPARLLVTITKRGITDRLELLAGSACAAVLCVTRLAENLRRGSLRTMHELVFDVTQETDSGFVAEALGESIFTEADTWEELRANVKVAVKAFYFDRPAPARVRLHMVRDEVLA